MTTDATIANHAELNALLKGADPVTHMEGQMLLVFQEFVRRIASSDLDTFREAGVKELLEQFGSENVKSFLTRRP